MTRRWVLWILFGSLLVGCGSQADAGGTDGSTHWLRHCSSDDDCGSGLSCICNTCTLDCTSDLTCDERSGGVASQCLALDCSGGGSIPACSSSCDEDADCGSHGECVGGACLALPTERQTAPNDSLSPSMTTASESPPLMTSEIGLGPLGAACLPGDEYSPDFPGFSLYENSVAQTAQCESGVCLVNYFQGRVTCPEGYDGEGESDCAVPGTEEQLAVPAPPQLQTRPPGDAVYCSCRCDGPVDSIDYCECGDGFECTPLIDFPLRGAEDVQGSYCTKVGAAPESPDSIAPISCQNGSCGESSEFTPEGLGISASNVGRESSLAISVRLDLFISSGSGCLGGRLPMVSATDNGLGVSCMILEARAGSDPCDGPARTPVSSEMRAFVQDQLRQSAECASDAECADFQVCEITQLTIETDDGAFESCVEDAEASGDGWCYLDPSIGLGTDAVVGECERKLRTIGEGAPGADTVSFLGCVGTTW